MLRRSLALALLCTAFPPPLTAQSAKPAVPRPMLAQTADTNDWNAYYVYGLVKFNESPKEAYNAFYWASRLNPESAEALYGQWATFWMSDLRRFVRFLNEDRGVVNSDQVVRNDSLMYRALQLNPMLHTALEHRMISTLYQYLRTHSDAPQLRWDQTDPYTAGMVHYHKGEMGPAAEKFRIVVQRRPRQRTTARLALARAHFFLGNHDSSTHHLGVLLEEMRKNDEKKIVFWYQNKAMMEYSIGYVLATADRYDEAREAYGRALTEDLSFHIAHARLGSIARLQGDTGMAVHEFGMAVELRKDDPSMLSAYGAALVDAKRADEAEPHLRRAVEIEPYLAFAWYHLARSLDEQRKAQEALDSYAEFLSRAPRGAQREVTLARRRMAALRSIIASSGTE